MTCIRYFHTEREYILELTKSLVRGCGSHNINQTLIRLRRYADLNKYSCIEGSLCISCQKAKEILLKAIEDELLSNLKNSDYIYQLFGYLSVQKNERPQGFELIFELEKLHKERIELLNKCKEMLI